MKIVHILFILLFSVHTLQASSSEDKLKVLIIGKVAKYFSWKNSDLNAFTITVIDNPFKEKLNKYYKNKKILSKKVNINYINSISELGNPNILYIPSSQSSNLAMILKATENKNILTISDIRGFAQKQGMLQLYFASRKIKLKINIDRVKKEKLNVRSTLLRIAKVIKEN